MYEDINLSKLPQLYDQLVRKGYPHSFNHFLEELFSLITQHPTLINYCDNQLTLNIPDYLSTLDSLVSLLTETKTIETQLSIYQNEELILAKQHLATLTHWGKSNKFNLPNPITVDSFSSLNQKLNPLSHFFTLYE